MFSRGAFARYQSLSWVINAVISSLMSPFGALSLTIDGGGQSMGLLSTLSIFKFGKLAKYAGSLVILFLDSEKTYSPSLEHSRTKVEKTD